MTERDAAGMPDGRDGLRTMGWVPLPYSSAGLVRKTGAGKNNTVWSWLIVMPWATDAKPWIDGVEVVPPTMRSEAEEREQIIAKMRSVLDERYGEVVGNQVVDDFIRRIQDET